MSIELEEWFVIGIVLVVVIEAPAFPNMAQASELKRVGAPDPGHFATVLDLFPSLGIDMGILRQGRYEFITVIGTALRESGVRASSMRMKFKLTADASLVPAMVSLHLPPVHKAHRRR
jgi:hypothetical protein